MFAMIAKALRAFFSRRANPEPARPTNELERLQSDIAHFEALAADYDRLGCYDLALAERERVRWYRKILTARKGFAA